MATVVVVALLLGVPLALNRGQWDVSTSFSAPSPTPSPTAVRPPGWPAASSPEAVSALGAPEPLTAASQSYGFLAVQPDGSRPIAYDPCRSIHYVTRPDNQPAGGSELVAAGVDRISRATGLVFVDDGQTDEAPSRQRPLTAPALYGDRWSPVLIAWQTADENPDLASDVLGEAGSSRVTRSSDGLSVYVTGQVQLDAAQFTALLAKPGGDVTARVAVIHELAHLVGLAHVNDPTQLMYPEVTPGIVDLGAGDLTGLAALGRGACVPDL